MSFRSLLSFDGRIGRETYWTIGVLIMLAKLCAVFAAGSLMASSMPEGASQGAFRSPLWAFSALLDLALLWPLMALQFRRAHDRDHRGWFPASLIVISTVWHMVPPPVLGTLPQPVHSGAMGAIYGLIGLTLVLQQGCMPGTLGENRYGQAPTASQVA